MAADLSERLLHYLDEHESFNSLKLAEKLGEDHQRIVGAIKSLQSLGNVSQSLLHYKLNSYCLNFVTIRHKN